MKKVFIIFFALHGAYVSFEQDIPSTTREQLEDVTNAGQTEIRDDSYLQQLNHFIKHHLNLNSADASELRELVFLTDLQIDNLIAYRKLLGKLENIYELQSIPGWDLSTIERVLPYVSVENTLSLVENFHSRLKGGDKSLLFRYSEVMEKSVGFDKTIPGTKYLGSRPGIFFRYRYQYKNLLQYGITGDKDPGEQFLRGVQKYGFDFYSFHLFAKNMKNLRAFALGDFTVNMGQGLIQWQGLAFSKGAGVLDVKRQSSTLRPYSSSGEFYFQRGIGLTVQWGKIEVTGFASIRKLSANFAADTLNTEGFVSSFQNSGYHRTPAEIADRNNLRQTAAGSTITYLHNSWHISVNAVGYEFSIPILKQPEPYNLFAIRGRTWSNFSVDYSYTHSNYHFFGEEAVDKNLNKAALNGLLVSVDPQVDLCIVQRNISKKYQAVYGNAFTENTSPTNEKGLYAGVSVRPSNAWRWDAYADYFSFPWLKYGVSAPGYGTDFLLQGTFAPTKQLEIYSRFKSKSKPMDESVDTSVTIAPASIPTQSLRTEISDHISPDVSIRQRVEILWYDKKTNDMETGFLIFFDIIYKPILKPYEFNARVQYFETNSYNSAIYAFEDDMLYNFSIPAFFNKGYRYYINLNYNRKKLVSFWCRWSRTIYTNQPGIGSGLDLIQKNHRSEVEMQVRWQL